MNTIHIQFIPCSPAPANGYNIQWRVSGTLDAYTDAGNFISSPATFSDNINPDGTQYEGFIRSDCGGIESGGTFGNQIPWITSAP